MQMNLSQMAALRPAAVRYIVVHTADYAGRDCDAEMINRWHREERGWPGIGYHYVILNDRHATLPDGLVQTGRPLGKCGSHVRGLNRTSVGVCCVGKGDAQPLTAAQMESLAGLVVDLMHRFGVPLDQVIGHREVNRLVDEGVLPETDAEGVTYRTTKSCPGRRVEMETVRDRVAARLLAHIIHVAPVPAIVVPDILPPVPPPIVEEVVP